MAQRRHRLSASSPLSARHRVTFTVRGKWVLDFVRFQLVYLIALVAKIPLLSVCIRVLGLTPLVAHAVRRILVVAAPYSGNGSVSFRRKGAEGKVRGFRSITSQHRCRQAVPGWRGSFLFGFTRRCCVIFWFAIVVKAPFHSWCAKPLGKGLAGDPLLRCIVA